MIFTEMKNVFTALLFSTDEERAWLGREGSA